jgi:hypothetical protein
MSRQSIWRSLSIAGLSAVAFTASAIAAHAQAACTNSFSSLCTQYYETAVFNVDQFTGTDMCAQINAAYRSALAPANGVILDARGFTGTQSCGQNPFAGANKPGILLLGSVTIKTTAKWVTPQSQFSIVGVGGSTIANTSQNTVLEADTAFPINTPLIQLGALNADTFGNYISGMALDCAPPLTTTGIAGCIGVYSTQAQERSGIINVAIRNTPAACAIFDQTAKTGGAGTQNFIVRDVQCTPGPNSTSSTYGFEIKSSSGLGPAEFRNVTITGYKDPVTSTIYNMGYGVYVNGTVGGVYSHIHCEYMSSDCVYYGDTSATNGGFFQDISTSATVAGAAAHIHANVTHALFNAISVIPAASAVNDEVDGITLSGTANKWIPQYIVGGSPFALTFATLPTHPTNGMSYYCSDCKVTSSTNSVCTSGGTGAFAQRLNGTWICD